MTREAQAHGASVRLDLAPALPSVVGDRVQLQQVVLNLVINAIQAMASDTARPRELSIRSRQHEAGQVLIEVADSGHGIGSKNSDQLFKAFFTTKPAGMGMGLSICRSIIEAHGGTVWATDNMPRGAVFHFTLPAG
jgi:signal transduction histidine kinase